MQIFEFDICWNRKPQLPPALQPLLQQQQPVKQPLLHLPQPAKQPLPLLQEPLPEQPLPRHQQLNQQRAHPVQVPAII